MSQRVHRSALHAGLIHVLLDKILEASGSQGLPALADEEAVIFNVWPDTQIGFEGSAGLVVQSYMAIPLSLACREPKHFYGPRDALDPARELHVSEAHARQLRAPHARSQEQFDDRAISSAVGVAPRKVPVLSLA